MTSSRRQFGSIRQLPSRRYQARYRDLDGTEHTAPHTFKTKREAGQFLDQARSDLFRGEWRNPSSGRVTFRAWSETYLESSPHKRATTLSQDRHVLGRHLLPYFGEMPLSSIQPSHVSTFVSRLGEKGLAPSTIRGIVTKLRTILNRAVEAEVLARSPYRGIRLPSVPKTEIRVLQRSELARLAQEIGPEHSSIVLLAGIMGLRFSEIAGLRVGRVDLLNGTISIQETADQLGNFAEPKTPASRRTLALPVVVSDALALHLSLRGLTGADTESLVFAAPRGGRLHQANWHKRTWQPAVVRCGLDGLTFHALRHSAVATMILLSAHPKIIQQRLGHTDIRTTLDTYGHLFNEADAGLNSLLDDHFSGASGTGVARTLAAKRSVGP